MTDPPGVEIRGPSALGVDPRRFATLTRTLAVADFKLRFFGSALGYLWQLVRPLLLFGVLYVVFTEVVRLGDDVRFYPVALLLGVVLFVFVSEATGGAVTSLVDRENLVRKIQFPRLVVPMSVTLVALFNLGLNLVVVLVFLIASGGGLRVEWLELIPLLALLIAFASGLAMWLSALYVRYRDVKPIWEVALQITFYGSPIFYPITLVEQEWLRELLMCNPFAVILQQLRHAVIDPSHPSAAAAAGGELRLLIPLAILVAIVTLGYRYFAREAPKLAEEL